MTRVDYDAIARCYEIHERHPEMSISQVASRAQVPYQSCHRYLSDPGRYDPYLDEVALVRALEGDRAVFSALTVFEKREFWVRALERDDVPYDLLGIDDNAVQHRRRMAARSLAMRTVTT